MPTLADVCRHIRSKNAGPFWITLDLFFKDDAAFELYADAAGLRPAVLAPLLNTDATMIKRYPVASLNVLKLSYPRHSPQGGAFERDMHGGQQYVALLDLEL